MDDRFNTAAGWVLFSGVIALGLSAISSRVFDIHAPENPGYPIEVAEGADGEGSGPDLGTLLAAADPAKGETAASARCGTCHTFASGGANGQGPNLFGIMGNKVAHMAGFGYSSAMASHGGTWTWEDMNDWILNPRKHIEGTSMGFAGLKNDEQRADILAYLNTLGSNLPLPAPKAAEEPAAEEGEEGVDGAAEGPDAVDGGDPSAVEAAGAMGAAQPAAGANSATP